MATQHLDVPGAETGFDRPRRTAPYEPAVVDTASHGRSTKLTIALGILMVAVVAGIELLPPGPSRVLIMGTAIVLAGLGVVSLFALALGLIGFNTRMSGDIFSRAFVDGETSGILVTDAEGRVLYANRAYADMTGALKSRDVRTVERVFAHSGEAEEEIYRLNRHAAAGEPASREVRVVDHPGLAGSDDADDGRWYRISCRPMPLADPATAGLGDLTAWQIADITAERAGQEGTFEAVQQAVEALDEAPAGFISTGADGTIRYVNATLARWLGLDLTAFQRRGVKLGDLTASGPWSESRMADGTLASDVDFLREGQSPFQAHMLTRASEDIPGASHIFVLDRSAIAASDAPDASQRAARLFSASPMAIASLSADGRILQSNAAFSRAFQKGEKLPVSLAEMAGGRPSDEVVQAFEAVKDGEAVPPVEIVTASEEVIRVNLVSAGGADENDENAEVAVLYALEVTEQRALETQMAQGQKMQAVGQLAGGIAHDFNNVLTAIIGFSDLLLANHRPSDRSFHDITNIKQSANKAASLVRQLLAFSRRQTLRPQVLSIPDVLTDLSIMLRRLAGDKIRVDIKHGRDLWPIKADVGQLEQVVVNLCVNARDAINDKADAAVGAGEKPEEGQIRIRTRNLVSEDVRAEIANNEVPASDYLVLEVSDTGTGMSKAVMAKIFDPFFSTKETGKGTGLGLSTVYGIVKQSGGYVEPDSEVGQGTTFRILLPRHVPVAGEEEIKVVDAPKEKARDLAGTATIVFVEDEDAVRAVGTRSLQGRGYTVHEAENGEEALEIIEDLGDSVDLVVSDVVMPEMDGPTLFRHVRDFAPDLPFIFASGYAEDAFEKSLPNAEDARFAFIPKPYSLKDLATIVKETLESEGV